MNKKKSNNIFTIARQLATETYKNHSEKYRKRQQRKIIFYVFLKQKFSRKWFDILYNKDLKSVFPHRPYMYIKPFRPYISIKWNTKQKLKVILDSYRFLSEKKDFLVDFLQNKEAKTLANLFFNDEIKGELKLGYDNRFRKEGELVLWFESEQLGGRIISVAFSFEETEKNNWTCLIGCVQGQIADSQNFTKETQKLMYGLRPKAFIIYALQELAREWGCSTIYGVGDAIQSYRKKHAIHLAWTHKIHFNYDELWLENGAKNMGKGWFELPLVPVRKDLQEIKSKKRSMYRKRYQMLDEISAQITEFAKK